MQSRLTPVIFYIPINSFFCARSFKFLRWQLAVKGDTVSILRLVKAGVDINTSDYDQRSPLHLAASTGQLVVVSCLLANGADVNVLDRFGRTALDDARTQFNCTPLGDDWGKRSHAIIDLLLAAGGKQAGASPAVGTSSASTGSRPSSYGKTVAGQASTDTRTATTSTTTSPTTSVTSSVGGGLPGEELTAFS